MTRYGMTVPLEGIPLSDQREWFESLDSLGYTDLWSSEAGTSDGFTPLSLAAVWAPRTRLGSAIVPAYTRGPATLAMCVGSLADAAPGRFVFGMGTSSNVIVERWNDIPFEKPYAKVRDTVRFLRKALTGEKVVEEYETFHVDGFRLGRVPKVQPKIMLAALRQGMLRLAGREADGAILNWLSVDDVKKVVPYVHAGGEGKEIVARLFVCPLDDPEKARAIGRRAIAAYLTVPVYAAFHAWVGREAVLADMWQLWKQGKRSEALEAIPDQVVDDLVVHGSPDACREHIARYVAAGIHTPVIQTLGFTKDPLQTARDLAPR